MEHSTARVHALKAAIEMRSGVDGADAVIARAKKFEEYIAADGLPAIGPAGGEREQPEKAAARDVRPRRT